MSVWFAALVLVAAVVATYLFCVRPMRRGECAGATHGAREPGAKERELAELRREVQRLREESTRDETAG